MVVAQIRILMDITGTVDARTGFGASVATRRLTGGLLRTGAISHRVDGRFLGVLRVGGRSRALDGLNRVDRRIFEQPLTVDGEIRIGESRSFFRVEVFCRLRQDLTDVGR